MDDPEQIFSPEALRLLGEGQGSHDAQVPDSIDSWEKTSVDDFRPAHDTTCPPTEFQIETKNLDQVATVRYSTFPASTDGGPSRKRTKFEDPKRRAEVARIRKEGACIRCRWNKIPVSERPDFAICKISFHIVLEYASVPIMYVQGRTSLEAPMDELRAVFLEEREYLRAWYCQRSKSMLLVDDLRLFLETC